MKFDKTDLGIPERIRYIYLRNDTIRVTSSQTTHVFLISQGKLEPIGPLSNSDISDNCTPYISIDDWKSHDYGGVYYHPKVCVRFLKRYVNKETQHIIAFYNKI